jgi:hypothetical protein
VLANTNKVKEDGRTRPDLQEHLVFVMKKGNPADTGFEFILHDRQISAHTQQHSYKQKSCSQTGDSYL